MTLRQGLLFLTILFMGSCGITEERQEDRVAKGDVYYHGIFRLNEVEDFRNLYPLNITEATSYRLAAQVYEGLVKLSQKDLTIIPGLAEKWEVNDSATVFTFHLRKGVMFQDDPCFPRGKGREVTSKDFKYCFEKLCTSDLSNQGFYVFEDKVKGANEYHKSTVDKKPLAGGVSGISTPDDYTVVINLTKPFSGFLYIMTMPFTWVFPKEAVDKYGLEMRVKCVGTGPFYVKQVNEGEAVILARNNNYWDTDSMGNKLPYLDAIKMTFIKEKKAELLEFKKGNLDMIYQLPFEMVGEVLGGIDNAGSDYGRYQYQVNPAMRIQFYGFQNQSKLFGDKRVRQAFNYAIDRRKIVDYTLQGEGIPAENGIVPPAMTNYDYESIKGFSFNPDKAKKLLSEAGYPNGKGFPTLTLQLNSGGARNTQIAEIIQKMIKENLNITIELNIMPFAQHLENLETGKALFWRFAWVADYPDPENFLQLFYGKLVPPNLSDKSYVNSVRYINPEFDRIFEAARREVDIKKRNELYRQADQLAIEDAALMPIYYDENFRLLQENVRNFDANAMEFRDFTRVYLVPPDKMGKKKAVAKAAADSLK